MALPAQKSTTMPDGTIKIETPSGRGGPGDPVIWTSRVIDPADFGGVDPSLFEGLTRSGDRQYSNQYGTVQGARGVSAENPYGLNSGFYGKDKAGKAVNFTNKYWGHVQSDPLGDYVPGWNTAQRTLGLNERQDKNLWVGYGGAFGRNGQAWADLPVGTDITGLYGWGASGVPGGFTGKLGGSQGSFSGGQGGQGGQNGYLPLPPTGQTGQSQRQGSQTGQGSLPVGQNSAVPGGNQFVTLPGKTQAGPQQPRGPWMQQMDNSEAMAQQIAQAVALRG